MKIIFVLFSIIFTLSSTIYTNSISNITTNINTENNNSQAQQIHNQNHTCCDTKEENNINNTRLCIQHCMSENDDTTITSYQITNKKTIHNKIGTADFIDHETQKNIHTIIIYNNIGPPERLSTLPHKDFVGTVILTI